ncbi:MAG: SDR family NAD(P)-dependent oxidoreductase [Mycobacterium sp.]
MDLNGRTALLSGATGGLGRAIANALAERGAKLILSSRKADDLKQLAGSLPGAGHTTIVCDLAEEGAALALLEQAGDIDVLVANAALPGSGRLESFSQAEIGRAFRVNLESPMRMARELLPGWQKRGSGHFVFISSLSGIAPLPRSSIYAATKFGLRGFALSLREDLRGSGVSASVISPGAIRGAGMFEDSGATPPPAVGTGTPKQVAGAVVRAIERDKSEVSVAPLRQRAFARFAMLAPEISGRIMGSTAANAADEVAAGQTDKR